jgi:hypothetical protein
MPNRAAGLLRTHKYAVLLAVLLACLVLQSFGPRPGLAGVVADVLMTILGVTIFVVVFEDPRERAVAGAFVIAVLATGWARHVFVTHSLHALFLAHQALSAVYFWITVGVILRNLFRMPSVGGENVRGAICGYLIAGAAWGSCNGLAYLLDPTAFAMDPKVATLLADWHGRVALFSYYSFTQLLTIGYADVTPVRAPATTLSLLAALFGVFYTAVVVSQLVGMAQRRGDRAANDS